MVDFDLRQHMHPNEQLTAKLFSALAAGNIGEAAALWAENCVDHAAVRGAPPGRPGVQATLVFVRNAFPSAEWRITNIVADRDSVACQVVVDGLHQGDIYGVRATGRPVRWRQFHFFRFRDGYIVEHDAVRDDRGLLEQLGVGLPGKG